MLESCLNRVHGTRSLTVSKGLLSPTCHTICPILFTDILFLPPQSACLSILLYTTACIPGLEESNDQDGGVMGIPSTTYSVSNNTNIITTAKIGGAHLQDGTTESSVTFNSSGEVGDTTTRSLINFTDPVSYVPSSTLTASSTSSPLTIGSWISETASVTLIIEPTTNGPYFSNFSTINNATVASEVSSVYNTSLPAQEHPLLSKLLPRSHVRTFFDEF